MTPRLITTLSASRRDDNWCTNCRDVIPTRASVRHSGSVLPTPSAMLSPISRQGIKPRLLLSDASIAQPCRFRFTAYHVEMNNRLMRAFGVAHRMAKRFVGTIEPDLLCQIAPRIGGQLQRGSTGNRLIHPRRQRRGAEQCCDDATQHGDAQELSRRHTHAAARTGSR